MPHSAEHRAGYPAVTRREAHALAHAREALHQIAERARRQAFGRELESVRSGTVLEERAGAARDGLTAFLIAAEVYAESSQAHAALERS
jgi:hypothetical protein